MLTGRILAVLFHVVFASTLLLVVMKFLTFFTALSLPTAYSSSLPDRNGSSLIDTGWHAPRHSEVNNLTSVINGTGIYGFVFNSSTLPVGVRYGTYNWCNMPHVRATEYPRANSSFKLEYIEVIHRHHKRTPYAANTFPVETYPWYCDDEGLFYYGAPLPPSSSNRSATPYWSVYTSPANPLAPQGFNGTCQFPQITRGGLDDSWQHGKDLASVYRDLLGFIPPDYDPKVVSFRVTNNVITSQVAGMVLAGMFPSAAQQNIPLLVQPDSVDSLEPAYTCTAASNNYSSFATGSSSANWTAHLSAASSLYSRLDAISGISPQATDWHVSFDHYFDNLSSRLCHDKPLPCNASNPGLCVTQAQADEVFRLGEYEYSFTYRDAGAQTLEAAVGSFGIWVAELARNLRHAMDPGRASSGSGDAAAAATTASSSGSQQVRYRHNVAHDGSVSRLLAILQIDRMVWPGMGSEVVFELFSSAGSKQDYFVRVLWGGQVLTSSNPTLGRMDMVPAKTLLAYLDALVGVDARLVPGICKVR